MGPFVRRLFVLITSICVILSFGLLAGCGSGLSSSSSNTSGNSGGSGSSGSGSSSGYVYTAGANAINAYSVNSDGSLTAVSGSPYSAGTVNFIVTNGSNVYTIASDNQTLDVYSLNKSSGALTMASSTNAIAGNPNTGDFAGPLSLDHTGTSLYVQNYDSSGDDGYNFFNVSSGSTATQVQWDGSSEVFGPALVFSPDNNYAYSGNCYHASWSTFRYTRASNGTLSSPTMLTGADGSPVMNPGDQPCPVAFAVSATGYLAIAYSAQPQPGTFLIGTYKINSDGSLTPVTNSMATTASNGGTNGQSTVAINFDPTGTYLAVAGNGGVQTFSLGSSGLLTAAGSAQDAGTAFLNVGWDKSNHVFATTSSQLYVWTSNNGNLSPVSGSPYSGGAGLAVLPSQ